MKELNRTESSMKNSIYSVVAQAISVILAFVVRTVFIKTLSSEYLGINGLFSNIITMLSLADLGISLAIPFTLYKPLAEKNQKKIKILMNFYGKVYSAIGIIVFLIGMLFIPLLPFLIKSIPDVPNFILIYILFVVNAAVSYFFIYKQLLIQSDQKIYVIKKITIIINVITSILYIVILLTTHNYILYLVLTIISTLILNLIISNRCNHLYPYMKQKEHEKLTKEELEEIKSNVGSLLIYRVGIVIINGTDNIIISKILGIIEVGKYSNYLLITNSLSTILGQITTSITASIGNLVATNDTQKSETILHQVMLLNFFIYSICSICLCCLINPFMKLWIGESYLLSNLIAVAIAVNFYVYGMQSVIDAYRSAYGLFYQGRYRPIIMVIVNIVVSILLAFQIGTLGVIIGTIVSRIFVLGIYDPIVIYRYGFKSSSKQYFKNYIKYFSIFFILCSIVMIISSKIILSNFIFLILYAFVILIIVTLILVLCFFRNTYFKELTNKFKIILKKV